MDAPKALLGSVLAILGMTFTLAMPATAQGLLLEKAQQTHPELPAHGLSMADVEAQWGQPISRKEPVGEPPITRWIYPTFTVYFEYDKVIHSVAHSQNNEKTIPTN